VIRACFHKLQNTAEYPQKPPFDPPEIFPEFQNAVNLNSGIDKSNIIYPAVRELLLKLKLDSANQGTARWNPLRDFVKENQTVLIKPNLVTDRHPHGNKAILATLSHPSIIRAFIDYARLAVGKGGRIIVGDTPIENCDFAKLCEISGLQKMMDDLRERQYENLELLDFRTFRTIQYPDSTIEKILLSGDPRGYTDIDLGKASLFQDLEDQHGKQNYYTLGDHSVDHIDPKTRKVGLPNQHHFSGRHVYKIPNSILESDFVICLAKLKTHKFSGVTLCLKNAIGICAGKEFLPHRRPGTPAEGGDSFPDYPSAWYVRRLRFKRSVYHLIGGKTVGRLISFVRKIVPAKLPHEIYTEPLYGDWFGNDTIWRTTLDLNLVFCHADRNGLDLQQPKRTYLGVIDGIIGMDHEAPMTGVPVQSNLLIAGRDPVAVDTLGTYMMGFDPQVIPTITGACAKQCISLGDVTLTENQIVGNIPPHEARCSFEPTRGWAKLLKAGSSKPFFETTR
jgi:uncharacterized protein (DUF362 family)